MPTINTDSEQNFSSFQIPVSILNSKQMKFDHTENYWIFLWAPLTSPHWEQVDTEDLQTITEAACAVQYQHSWPNLSGLAQSVKREVLALIH